MCKCTVSMLIKYCSPDGRRFAPAPPHAAFDTFLLCRTSSTFANNTVSEKCRKSSIFIVKFSTWMWKNLFDTCVVWSCVTRCRCGTTSSTLFTVHMTLHPIPSEFPYTWGKFSFFFISATVVFIVVVCSVPVRFLGLKVYVPLSVVDTAQTILEGCPSTPQSGVETALNRSRTDPARRNSH